MHLYELAYGCHLYAALTDFDASIDKVRGLAAEVDPHDPTHQKALFDWLNDWGCRQFSLEHHETVAAPSLVEWAGQWLDRLPALDESLESLDHTQLDEIAAAYSDLSVKVAGYRDHHTGVPSDVRFGPVGASKVLLALRPHSCPPWDRPIIRRLGFGGGRTAYRRYLEAVCAELAEVAAEAGVEVAELPALVDRPHSSPPKLIDEYNWVTITRGMQTPTLETLTRWTAWAAVLE